MPFVVDRSKPPIRITSHDEAMVIHAQNISLALGGFIATMYTHSHPRLMKGLSAACYKLMEAIDEIPWESAEMVEWFRENNGHSMFRLALELIEQGANDEAMKLMLKASEKPLLLFVRDDNCLLVEGAR